MLTAADIEKHLSNACNIIDRRVDGHALRGPLGDVDCTVRSAFVLEVKLGFNGLKYRAALKFKDTADGFIGPRSNWVSTDVEAMLGLVSDVAYCKHLQEC